MSKVYVSTVSLSEAGLSLLLLENELNNNDAEVDRLTARLQEAETLLAEAIQRRRENRKKLAQVLGSIKDHYWLFYQLSV